MQVGKFLKNIKRAGHNRRAGGKIFLKNIKRAGRNKRAGGKFRRPDIYKLQKRANLCLQKCPKQNTSLRNNYVNFLGHLSSNGFQLKGRFGTHEILNIPISINVQDGINVQGGIFPQNQ